MITEKRRKAEKWFWDHFESLQINYGNQYIAIYEGEVYDFDKLTEEGLFGNRGLIERIRKLKIRGKKVPFEDILITSCDEALRIRLTKEMKERNY